jgi:colicin import membrane protein
MISSFYRSSDAASPWMIVLSACFHGFFVLAMIILATVVPNPPKPPEEAITRVKLVEPVPGPSVVEKLSQSPAGEGEPLLQEDLALQEVRQETSPEPRSIVEGQSLKVAAESIAVRKRKKPMRRVEKPKSPEKKPEESVAKKEDPSAALEKKLAALRKEVADKKADPGPARAGQGTAGTPPTPGQGGLRNGADVIDRELFRWFAAVRIRVNGRWSVFSDSRHPERATIVGVQIADDGRLLGAAVDESSGDEVFDRSAMRAILQAAPFPQVPPDVSEKIRKAGGLAFRFTVKGMQ